MPTPIAASAFFINMEKDKYNWKFVKPPDNKRFIDRTGEIYWGNLLCLGYLGKWGKQTAFAFRCGCGNELGIRASAVINGNTKSCGCLQLKRISEALSKDLT